MVERNTKSETNASQAALASWENEGGADRHLPANPPNDSAGRRTTVDPAKADIAQLQIRVVALENLVTALLAAAPVGVVTMVRDLTELVSPKLGHLTMHAATQMVHTIQRAEFIRMNSSPFIQAVLR